MGAGEQRAARRALRACMVAEEGRKEGKKEAPFTREGRLFLAPHARA